MLWSSMRGQTRLPGQFSIPLHSRYEIQIVHVHKIAQKINFPGRLIMQSPPSTSILVYFSNHANQKRCLVYFRKTAASSTGKDVGMAAAVRMASRRSSGSNRVQPARVSFSSGR